MKLLTITLAILGANYAFSQNVGINTTGAAPAASAMLDVASTTSGFLMPRMTSAQRTAITTPATGLQVYDLTTNTFWWFNGTIWVQQISGATGDNGLTNSGSEIDLGGALNQATTITQGNNTMTFNLTGTGDFFVQDNGTTTFAVQDNGETYFGDDVLFRDGNVGGTILGSMVDDGNDGRFTVRENGNISVDLDANTQFIFNEQGFDRNYRIESDDDANMFFLDAGLNRLGLGTNTPDNLLDVEGKISVTQSPNDEMVIINDDIWQHSSGNQDFGDGGAYFFVASREGDNESAGIYGDGDHVTIWSPGDQAPGQPNALLYVCDEDDYNGDGNPFDDFALHAYLNSAGNWVNASDERRKENITPLNNVLENLIKVNTYSYNFKLNEEEIAKGDVAPHALGVIAQEVEKLFPDVVEKSDAGSYYVSYSEFIPLLIQAVKEQQSQIDALAKENESLTNTNEELQKLRKELEEIKSQLK